MAPPSVQEQELVLLVPALYQCAAHVSEGSLEKANFSLSEIKRLSSIADGPLQRLPDALARRLLLPCEGLAGALIHPSDYFERSGGVRSARRSFAGLSPFLHAAFAATNRAILEAMEDEKVVRIVDLSCCSAASHPCQWLDLLHGFVHGRARPPPEVRLTVVHDDDDFVAAMRAALAKEADRLNIPFQFNHVLVVRGGGLETIDLRDDFRDVLGVKYGEAVAVSCCLQMHRLLAVAADDDSASSSSALGQLQNMATTAAAQLKQMACSSRSPASILNYPRTPSPQCQCQVPRPLASFLGAVHRLKPSIVVVMEQDANHNAPPFSGRFAEALGYYAALFDSLDAVAAATASAGDRTQVERMVLGEEIKNVLLCEGASRLERHERLSQWAMYMDASGFRRVPLSFRAIREGQLKLESFGMTGCRYQVESDGLLLGWGSTRLYSVSAWRPNKSGTGTRECTFRS
jgi:hypothetical protein